MQKAKLQLSVRLSLLLAALSVVFLMIGGSAEANVPTPAPSEYVVRAGDTLWAIAKRQYGDGGRYGEIYNANIDVIGPSPHLIKPGQRLVMPQ